MQISIPLDGKRGQKFRLVISQMGADVGGGTLWEIQQWRTTAREHKWTQIASGTEPTNDMGARVLAGWLLTPMPLKDLGTLKGHHNSGEDFKEDGKS